MLWITSRTVSKRGEKQRTLLGACACPGCPSWVLFQADPQADGWSSVPQRLRSQGFLVWDGAPPTPDFPQTLAWRCLGEELAARLNWTQHPKGDGVSACLTTQRLPSSDLVLCKMSDPIYSGSAPSLITQKGKDCYNHLKKPQLLLGYDLCDTHESAHSPHSPSEHLDSSVASVLLQHWTLLQRLWMGLAV